MGTIARNGQHLSSGGTMSSDPKLRQVLAKKLQEAGTVRADSITELKRAIGMQDVTNTQFGRALRSLHYNPGPVHVCRPHVVDMGPRPYTVSHLAS